MNILSSINQNVLIGRENFHLKRLLGIPEMLQIAKRFQEEKTQEIITNRLNMAHATEAIKHATKSANVLSNQQQNIFDDIGQMLRKSLGGSTGDPYSDYIVLLLRVMLIILGILLCMSITYFILALYFHLTGRRYSKSNRDNSTQRSLSPIVLNAIQDRSFNDFTVDGRFSEGGESHSEGEEESLPDAFDHTAAPSDDFSPRSRSTGPRPERGHGLIGLCIVMNKTLKKYVPPEGTELHWGSDGIDDYGIIINVYRMYDLETKEEYDLLSRCLHHIRVTKKFWESIDEQGCDVTGFFKDGTYDIVELEKGLSLYHRDVKKQDSEDNLEPELEEKKDE